MEGDKDRTRTTKRCCVSAANFPRRVGAMVFSISGPKLTLLRVIIRATVMVIITAVVIMVAMVVLIVTAVAVA